MTTPFLFRHPLWTTIDKAKKKVVILMSPPLFFRIIQWKNLVYRLLVHSQLKNRSNIFIIRGRISEFNERSNGIWYWSHPSSILENWTCYLRDHDVPDWVVLALVSVPKSIGSHLTPVEFSISRNVKLTDAFCSPAECVPESARAALFPHTRTQIPLFLTLGS